MNRIAFIIILFVPFFLLGGMFPEKFATDVFPILIVFYMPVIYVLRMRYLKMGWKHILMSFIPFYGLKYMFKAYTKK